MESYSKEGIRRMEQSLSWDQAMLLWSPNLWKMRQACTMKKSLFNNSCWEHWTGPCRKNEIRIQSNTIHKINSKWIKDWNVWLDIIKKKKKTFRRKQKTKPFSYINSSKTFFNPFAALVTIARIWKKSKCSSTEE